MKNWTSHLLLWALFLSLYSAAQESNEEFPFKLMLPCFKKSEKSILEHTASLEKHSTFLKVLKPTNLDQVLAYNGEFTVFAPSNMAFEKLSKITIDTLLDPKNKNVLKSIVSYHIIADKLSASTILRAMCRGNGTAKFTTMQGEKIMASMRGLDILLTDKNGNQAIIIAADSNQSNGIIHEIDTVFLPAKMF